MAQTVMGNVLSVEGQLDVDIYARGEDGRGIVSNSTTYQVSESGTVVPTGSWVSEMPEVSQGSYLWIRLIQTFNDDTTYTSYSVAYFSVDGAVFIPEVHENGDISWSNEKGLPNPETRNIRGPQGEPGTVKFYIVEELPTKDIESDAFYIMPAAAPTEHKRYDMYYYANGAFEKVGDDLTGYYNKEQIDNLFNIFIATKIHTLGAVEDKVYHIIGIETTGEDSEIYSTENLNVENSGMTYSRVDGLGKGQIDGKTITVGLFYDIS